MNITFKVNVNVNVNLTHDPESFRPEDTHLFKIAKMGHGCLALESGGYVDIDDLPQEAKDYLHLFVSSFDAGLVWSVKAEDEPGDIEAWEDWLNS